MSEVRNTQIVKQADDAFARGDINTILNLLDDGVEWEAVIGGEGVVPTAGMRRGRAAGGEFFQTLNQSVAFESFEPRQFVAQDDLAVVLGHYRGRGKHNGVAWETDWVMIFTVRGERIVKFREFTNSALLVRQWLATPA